MNTREHHVLTPARPLPAVAACLSRRVHTPATSPADLGTRAALTRGAGEKGRRARPPTSSDSGGGAGVPARLLELPQ